MRKFVFVVCVLVVLLLTGVAQAQEEFVFGVVMVGPHDDHGWSQSHFEAGQYIENAVPNSRMLSFDNLNAGNPEASLLGVVTEMVDEGAQLIFTTSDEFEEDTGIVAASFPDVVFINATGDDALTGSAPPNEGNFDGMMEVSEEIAGCAAALTSQTGHIGYVGPLIIPETRRLASSAFLGARYCWENYRHLNADNLQFTITWIGFWFNIPGVTLDPTEEARTLFDGGADVVFSALDTPEAVIVAGQLQENGESVYGIGYDNASACDAAPQACIGAPYYNWGPAYLQTALAVQSGTWQQSWDWIPPDYSDINNPDTSIVGFSKGPGMSEDVNADLDLFIAELAAYGLDPANSDSIFLWEGPLNLQDGTELAPVGETVDLMEIWYLPQLLEGIDGDSG